MHTIALWFSGSPTLFSHLWSKIMLSLLIWSCIRRATWKHFWLLVEALPVGSALPHAQLLELLHVVYPKQLPVLYVSVQVTYGMTSNFMTGRQNHAGKVRVCVLKECTKERPKPRLLWPDSSSSGWDYKGWEAPCWWDGSGLHWTLSHFYLYMLLDVCADWGIACQSRDKNVLEGKAKTKQKSVGI